MDGNLALLDLNTGEEPVLLLWTIEDADQGRSGRGLANRPLSVPDISYGFDSVAEPLAGEGQRIAIVSRDRVDRANLPDEHHEFEPIDSELDLLELVVERNCGAWIGEK